VTFTRATTAAYYNGSTTAMAEQNLTLYSQAFDTSSYWSFANVNITGNTTTAPDGTSTADSITIAGSVTSYFNIGPNAAGYFTLPANTPTTYSVYVKSNGSRYVYLGFYVASFYNCNFDLTLGTSNIISGGGTATITSVGNSWYRITWTFTPVASTGSYFYFGIGDSSSYVFPNTFAGTAGQGVYLWGAQVEIRSAVSAYTATTTQAITNYNPQLLTAGGGQPRFDHNPTTSESLGLLIEQQSTNLQTQSQYASGWTSEAGPITINTVIAPDGTLTGAKIVADTSTAVHKGYPATVGSLTTATTYTATVFMKAGGYNYGYIRDGYTGNYVIFDLSAGTVLSSSSATGAITSVGNSWYRCSAAMVTSGTNFRMDTGICSTNAQTPSSSWAGNGFSGIYIWGAQLEVGSFSTSYIPTTTAAATRAADFAQMTGANFTSWYNNEEGTLYAEGAPPTTTATGRLATISPSTTSSTQVYCMTFDGSNVRIYQTNSAGSLVYNLYPLGGYSANTFYRIVSAYQNASNAASVAAGTVATDSSAQPFGVMQSLTIGSLTGGAFFLNGPIKKIAYYPQRLTNAQLQALTS
jgi:hypothetical protein